MGVDNGAHMGLRNRALGPGGCREVADFFCFRGGLGGRSPRSQGSRVKGQGPKGTPMGPRGAEGRGPGVPHGAPLVHHRVHSWAPTPKHPRPRGPQENTSGHFWSIWFRAPTTTTRLRAGQACGQPWGPNSGSRILPSSGAMAWARLKVDHGNTMPTAKELLCVYEGQIRTAGFVASGVHCFSNGVFV